MEKQRPYDGAGFFSVQGYWFKTGCFEPALDYKPIFIIEGVKL
jgi:hypothetical protein